MSQTVEYGNAPKHARSTPRGPAGTRHLFLVPAPPTSASPVASTMWLESSDSLGPEDTEPEDWPMPRDFAPLIAAAAAAGNGELVRQLRKDQRYCVAMRRKLRGDAAGASAP